MCTLQYDLKRFLNRFTLRFPDQPCSLGHVACYGHHFTADILRFENVSSEVITTVLLNETTFRKSACCEVAARP
jgi:hypothetical protein